MPNSIDHYELDEALGTGTLGVTYRARDKRTGVTIALKLIQRSLALDADASARLRREARAASELDHPNIARVVEYGEHADDLYIASEFAEGETLRARLQRERCLSEAETHGIALCVAHALNAAHAVRVVHRNLTPQNIILADDGALRVCDFGVTQALDAVTPTNYAAFIAAPAYAAPELRERRGDIRSDLFSLGVIMLEALTGAAPPAPERVAAPRRGDAARQPNVAALNEASRTLSPIVQRLLKPNPKDRYADPGDLLRALQAVGPLASTRVLAPAAVPAIPIAIASVARTEDAERAEATERAGHVERAEPAKREGQPVRRRDGANPQGGLGRWMSKLVGRRAVDAALLSERLAGVIEDDALSEEKEAAFLDIVAALGVESLDGYPAIQRRLMIARTNDGRLPVMEPGASHCALRPGEAVHLEVACALLTNAPAGGRGSAGFAFPIVQGGRYRRSPDGLQALGRTVPVTKSGTLSVTSQRVVFSGQGEIEESLYSRLVFVRVFTDGLGISVSNRQQISTYRLLDTSGEVVAAVINAAAQKP